ncbi:MAG: 23S rRNA (uracil(1939)-C(5))-methyltransferase RlmD, partial [Clostridia bacterium]|nr:23S rRNA (uracil(1939)-C(5))-methyltransferase RlmD [Clostridia bacterium]
MKLIVGDIIEGEVIDLGINGEGVVKIDAYPVFVPFALPHEKIRAKVSFAKKDCAFADLIEVLTPSNERVKPVCCYFAKCGGCDLQHMSKDLQLDIKRESVERTIRRNAGIDVDVLPVVSLNEYAYRNKLSLPFGVNGEGKIILGFYAKRTHKVVGMKHCPLHGEWAADLIAIVTAWANEFGISAYCEGTGKGLLRHLVARKLDTISVALVINGFSAPHTAELCKSLENKFGKVTLYVSSNTKNTNVIMGDNLKLVGGEEYEQNIGGFNANISLLSFFQVNNAVRDAIYQCVADNIDGEVDELVELYSGVGLLT